MPGRHPLQSRAHRRRAQVCDGRRAWNASRWRSVMGIAIELLGMSLGRSGTTHDCLEYVEKASRIGISLHSPQRTLGPLICVNIVTIGAVSSVLFFEQEVL